MAFKKGHEVPTIDVELVTITTRGTTPTELALNTASKIAVNVQSETEDAVKLIVKGRLVSQKPQTTTITGHTIVLTDNVFNAEVVKVLQGGVVTFWGDAAHTLESAVDCGHGIKRYTPPVAGSTEKGETFILNAYSAIYNAAGLKTGYEKIMYPNCQGTPVALSSEDGAFRAPEYTINSAPDTGEAPYDIEYVDALPKVEDLPAPKPMEYTVTFNTLGHGVAPTPQTVVEGGTAQKPADPSEVGQVFGGWFTDPSCSQVYGFGTPVMSNLTLYAKWSLGQYTLTFDSQGGSEVEPITQFYNTPVTAPTAPTKEGHSFTGWVPAVPVNMPAENLTLVAQWTEVSDPEET